jgi:hypothetical protein
MTASSFIERAFAPNALPGRLVNRSWLGANARASAIEMEGFAWDSAVLPRPPDDGRAYLVLPLVGAIHLVERGWVVRPGQAVLFASARASFDERVVIFSPHRALALRIERSLIATARLPHVFDVPVEPAGRAHGAITQHEVPALAPIASHLCSAGVLRGGDLEAPGLEHVGDEPVARALSRALTFAGERPGLVDLQVDGMNVGARQARRRVEGFLARHRMPFAHWRELRQSLILTGAVLGLGVPGIRIGTVAKAAGFASPAGLCHGFERSGLPAPSAIVHAAQRLRVARG